VRITEGGKLIEIKIASGIRTLFCVRFQIQMLWPQIQMLRFYSLAVLHHLRLKVESKSIQAWEYMQPVRYFLKVLKLWPSFLGLFLASAGFFLFGKTALISNQVKNNLNLNHVRI